MSGPSIDIIVRIRLRIELGYFPPGARLWYKTPFRAGMTSRVKTRSEQAPAPAHFVHVVPRTDHHW